jgi:hypothetical protein
VSSPQIIQEFSQSRSIYDTLVKAIAFEAPSSSSSSPTRARYASTRCATMVIRSTSRISEEDQAQDNFEKMLIGDKYYILTCISRAMAKANVTDEGHIPWNDIYVTPD